MSDEPVLQLADLAAERRRKAREGAPPGEPRNIPVITWREGELARVVTEVDAALAAGGEPVNLYKSGSRLVQVGWRDIPVSGGARERMLQVADVNVVGVLYRISTVARFQRWSKTEKDWVTSSCPEVVAAAYLSLPPEKWSVPRLFSVVTAPTLRWNGTILSRPGYDAETGILYHPDEEFPEVPEAPSREDCLVALGKIKRLIKDFPFVGRVNRSIALAAIMTPALRSAMATAPAFCIDSPTAGTGKSLFIDVASVIATGHCAAVTSQGKNGYDTETELEKRLGSHLLAGDTVISIDNIEGEMSSSFLCQMLTQTTVSVRVLGLSKSVTCASAATVFINGNNLIMAGDLNRRNLQGRMDSKLENPENRRFESNVLVEARKRRGELVCAVLMIVRGCVVNGGEGWKEMAPLGSFDDWSRLIRYALVWLGERDPVSQMSAAKADDPRLSQLRAAVFAWKGAVGADETKTTAELIDRANERWPENERGEVGGLKYRDLFRAFMSVAETKGGIHDIRLGKWLRANMGRTIRIDDNEYRIIKERTAVGHSSKWTLRNGSSDLEFGDDDKEVGESVKRTDHVVVYDEDVPF